ncbi:MAG: transposase, partial [Candidatus Eisenbacteria bacterium]
PQHNAEFVYRMEDVLEVDTRPYDPRRPQVCMDETNKQAVRELVDEGYPQADKIVLVMDPLNTHGPASLYEAFPPAEAKRIADKLAIHHTPKHGSWLNMAEIELAALGRLCLDRRIADLGQLRREAGAWNTERNAKSVKVNWRFTTANARIKLRRLYPLIDP